MISQQQLTLLTTVTCHRTRPAPATAAADFIGIDESTTHRWLCKGQGKHPLLPVTEWLCSRLAMVCGLPVPQVAAVELATRPGEYYFGSQWQGGALEFLQVRGRISNSSVFAKTHALDLFVHNTDRHRGNYLYLDLAGEVVARVIDFSHSLLVMGWPLPSLPMAICNTTIELPYLLAEDPVSYTRPDGILNAIDALSPDWMQTSLDLMPTAWLDQSGREILDDWWRGSARQQRLDSAKLALP